MTEKVKKLTLIRLISESLSAFSLSMKMEKKRFMSSLNLILIKNFKIFLSFKINIDL